MFKADADDRRNQKGNSRISRSKILLLEP